MLQVQRVTKNEQRSSKSKPETGPLLRPQSYENATSFPGSLFFPPALGGGKKRDLGNEVDEMILIQVVSDTIFAVITLLDHSVLRNA